MNFACERAINFNLFMEGNETYEFHTTEFHTEVCDIMVSLLHEFRTDKMRFSDIFFFSQPGWVWGRLFFTEKRSKCKHFNAAGRSTNKSIWCGLS